MSHHTTTTATTALFPFFKLPAELRVNVYEFVFARKEDTPSETHLYILEDPDDYTTGVPKNSPYPPLLHASRQFRHEALSIFYSTTYFIATYDFRQRACFPESEVHDWLYVVGKENAKGIKHLTVRFIDWLTTSGVDAVLSEMVFRFQREEDQGWPPKVTAERFAEIFGFEAMGVEEGAVRIEYDAGDGSGSRIVE